MRRRSPTLASRAPATTLALATLTLATLALATLLLVTALPSAYAARPPAPQVAARAVLVADLDTGQVLLARHSRVRLRPASTLKLLTAITLLPGLDPARTLRATDAHAGVEGSRVGLVPGRSYTVDQLAHGLLLDSGNDAALALADLVGGVDAAVAAMNAEAARLGALDTHAAAPHGLDADGQLTTAYDLGLVARAAYADPYVAGLLATRTYDFPARGGRTFQIQNGNRLLGRQRGSIGGKTGWTSRAQHNLVTAVDRDGRRLVAVVLKADGRAEPIAERLLEWAYAAGPGAPPVGRLLDPQEVEAARLAPGPARTAGVAPAPTPTGSPAVAAAAAGGGGGVDGIPPPVEEPQDTTRPAAGRNGAGRTAPVAAWSAAALALAAAAAAATALSRRGAR